MNDPIFYVLMQLICSWMMIGIIWFIQLVHYPLYAKIKEGFIEYERSQIRRVAFLVGPIMLVEAITSIILVGVAPPGIQTKLAALNLILLIFIWISTFLFLIGQHQKLSIRFSKKTLHLLIATNWIRAILWTFKGVLIILMIYA